PCRRLLLRGPARVRRHLARQILSAKGGVTTMRPNEFESADAPPGLIERAKRYRDTSGLSVIPCSLDGSKTPGYDHGGGFRSLTWKQFQSRKPTDRELGQWYRRPAGFMAACGLISGGLEVVDVDDPDIAGEFLPALKEACPDLAERLLIDESPRPGLH